MHGLNAISVTNNSWVQYTLLIYFTKVYVSSVLFSSILFVNKMLSTCGIGPAANDNINTRYPSTSVKYVFKGFFSHPAITDSRYYERQIPAPRVSVIASQLTVHLTIIARKRA